MGIHDRPYMRDEPESGGGLGGLTVGLPKPTPAVKVLLIANAAAFLLQVFLDQPSEFGPGPMSRWLGVTTAAFWQPWRYVTFQFLHGDFMHILLNMLGVYFLGSALERHWGRRRFLAFYLSCGAVAGLCYVIIGVLFALDPHMPIIGASGGVYGILLACAVYFPSFRIIFLFFPVPIRFAALIIFGGMVVLVLQALGAGMMAAAMSDVAHLGGAGMAAAWIWVLPQILRHVPAGPGRPGRPGAWQKKLRQRRQAQAQIDRILDKIRREGLDSLSWFEKRTLRRETERQRREREP